jgi:hypothetical protein
MANRMHLEMSPGDGTEVSDTHSPKLMHILETQEHLAGPSGTPT